MVELAKGESVINGATQSSLISDLYIVDIVFIKSVHPTVALVLLSASIERFDVSRMRDFLIHWSFNNKIDVKI